MKAVMTERPLPEANHHVTLTLTEPTKARARVTYDSVASAVSDRKGIRCFAGYRKIEIGRRLTIRIAVE